MNVLTHCNAGWLACVDWGTALAPIYMAHDKGIPIHVWVDETRPRNQGGSLTAYELGAHGVKHAILADNAGGHYMQHGEVDMCIVGTDRTTASGDVANKIGTYLKALAAHDNNVPFYVALPSSTIDWTIDDGVKEIEIEERSGREITHVQGRSDERRGADRRADGAGKPGAQSGVRRDAGAVRHRAHHRARRRAGDARRPASAVSGAREVKRTAVRRRVARVLRSAAACRPATPGLRAEIVSIGAAHVVERAVAGAKRQRLGARRRRHADHADGHALSRDASLPTSSRCACDGRATPGQRVASSEWRVHLGDLQGARGCRRDRAHAFAERDGACRACIAAFRRFTIWWRRWAAIKIACAPYATYGSEELARFAVKALGAAAVPVCSPITARLRWARRCARRMNWRARSRRWRRNMRGRCRSGGRACLARARWRG